MTRPSRPRLFPRAAPVHDRSQPDCAYIHRELKRDGVTLQLLWEEYAQVHPHGYRRTQFCELYRQWARRLRPSMRQVHRAGEKTFIDLLGETSGAGRPAHRRIATRRAVRRRARRQRLNLRRGDRHPQLPDWVDAHTRMVGYYGGTTALWVPDQLKSAITRPCRYEPGVIAPTRTSPPTTAPSSSRRGRGNQEIKPPWRAQYSWPSGGYSPGSATRRSSASVP